MPFLPPAAWDGGTAGDKQERSPVLVTLRRPFPYSTKGPSPEPQLHPPPPLSKGFGGRCAQHQRGPGQDRVSREHGQRGLGNQADLCDRGQGSSPLQPPPVSPLCVWLAARDRGSEKPCLAGSWRSTNRKKGEVHPPHRTASRPPGSGLGSLPSIRCHRSGTRSTLSSGTFADL